MAESELLIRAAIRDELTGPLERIDAQVNRVAGSVARLDAAGAAGAKGGIAHLGTQVGGLHKLLTSADRKLVDLSRTVGSAFARALSAGALGLGALTAAVAVFGIKSASTFEQTRIALDGMLGSQAKGAAMFKDLQALNMKTPFGLSSVTAGARQLLGFQFQPEQILPVMKASTDIAAGLGAGEEGLQRILLNLGQVQSAGRVTGRELRDFAVLGVPGYAMVANILGKTKDEVRAMGDDAVVSADQFIGAWVKMQGPLQMFAGMAEKQMGSLQGLWSNVKDSFEVGMAAASKPLVDSLKGVIGPDGPLSKFVTEAMTTLAPPLAKFGGQVLTSLTQLLPALLPVFAALADGATRLLQAMAPGFEALRPVADELAGSLVELINALVPVMPDLTKAFVALVGVLPEFVRLLADIVPLAAPILRLLGGLLELGPVRDVLAGLLAVLLGYRVLHGIATAVDAMASALGRQATASVAAAEAEQTAAGIRGGGIGSMAGKAGRGIGIGLGAGLLGKQIAEGAIGEDKANTRGGKRFSNFIGTTVGLTAAGATVGGPWGALGGLALGVGKGFYDIYKDRNKPQSYWSESTDQPPPTAYDVAPITPPPTGLAAGGPGSPTINGPLIGNVENMSTDVDVEAAARRALAEADRMARERA